MKLTEKIYVFLYTSLLFLMLFHIYLEYFLIIYTLIVWCFVLFSFRPINKFIPRKLPILLGFLILVQLTSSLINFSFDLNYFKIFLNSIFILVLIHLSIIFGSLFSNKVYLLVIPFVLITFINSFTNIIHWYLVTGGVIERYNFISPITNNFFAGINLSSLAFYLTIATNFKSKFLKLFFLIVFLFNIVIIVVRQEQFFFMLFFLFLYFVELLIKRKHLLKNVLFLALILILLLFFLNFNRFFVDYYIRLFNFSSIDFSLRFETYRNAVNLFLSNPLFGVGYGNFILNLSEGINLASAHNGFFSMIAEFGLIGSLAMIVLFINILSKLVSRINKHASTITVIISTSILLSFLGFFISNSNFFPPPSERAYYLYTFIIWTFVGVIFQQKSNTNNIGTTRSQKLMT